ncbi:hypothetical protein M0D69_03630 [Caballeronia sp. SEWSISQ10-4 2]|uniref:hypothetical protein n=1 Tax=Caballeronia sp. SEWSISQ10-4 2 TaxID=2937438 RepID=UPI00264BC571|nr:hypothetical protein [Caballeronia sp. SEWSISQ10-4 2]MDN7177114.1 hypothetical protein [Caballeronia sp. SEWSISQ10-4 2]
MELHYRDDGVVTLDTIGRGRTARHLQNLVPRRMNEVVLCVGPCDAVWPTDMDLLSRMLESERVAAERRKAPVRRSPYRRWMRWSTLGLAAASLGGVAILVAPGQVSSAAAMRSPEALQRSAEQVSFGDAIAKLGMKDVHVARNGDTTLVTGMVATPNDKTRVAGVLERYRNLEIASRLTIAQDVADELQSSLGEPEVSVTYAGDGTFRVAGIARDVQNVQQRAERARIDFGSSIKRVAFDLKERASPDTSVSSMLATESLRYVELADGTKSFAELPAATDLNNAGSKPANSNTATEK